MMKKLNRTYMKVTNVIGILLILGAMCIISVLYNSYEIAQLKKANIEMQNIQYKQVEALQHMTGVMENVNKTVREQQVSRANAQRERQRIMAIKTFRIDGDTDLSNSLDISENEMNRIIDNWDDSTKHGTTFKGKGAVFIKAAKESGLSPLYLLAHAAWESNWGNSYIAKEKGNYFGINATDSNPYSNAYNMGSDVDQGIIAGAKWIKANYYDKGCTTLNKMIYKGNYASAKDAWINGITQITNASVKML